MTDELHTRITELQNRLAAAQRNRAHAEAAYAQAQAQFQTLTDQLGREYGIECLDEARAWIANARAELGRLVAQLDEQLNLTADPGRPT